MIDEKIISEYLAIIGKDKLDLNNFIIVHIEDKFPVERISKLVNEKITQRYPLNIEQNQ